MFLDVAKIHDIPYSYKYRKIIHVLKIYSVFLILTTYPYLCNII